MTEEQHCIILITGQVHGGKTSFLIGLIDQLKSREFITGGFLCPGTFDAGVRSEFRLLNIRTGEEVPMASVTETKDWMKYRRFWFNPVAFNHGREWIRECLSREAEIIVLDEVGPMELGGSGWSELLDDLVKAPVPVQLWSVRESLLDEVMERWGIPGEQVIRIDTRTVDETADIISEIMNKSDLN